MSTDDLQRELARIADRAPSADVPADTWPRARRSVVRERVAAGAAGLVVVAAVAAGVTWLPDRLEPPVAGNNVLGVPDHLYSVPGHVRDTDTNLAIGTGAAAWLETETDIPVVVDADDGAYHLLDLPDFLGENPVGMHGLYEPTISLSPDGRSLAYSWATFGKDAATAPIPSGIRVVDLMSGEIESFPLPGEEGTFVERIAWSPDGTWLGWAGARMGSWTEGSMGTAVPAAGRIHLSDGANDELVDDRWKEVSIGVNDGGLVCLGTFARVQLWDGESFTGAGFATEAGYLIPASNGGSWAFTGPGFVTIWSQSDTRDVSLRDGDKRVVRPIGWAGDDLVIATYASDGVGAIEVVDPGQNTSPSVSVADKKIRELSVAVDLMAGEDRTVSRAEPDWPWSSERWSLTIGLGVAGLLSLLWGARRARRRYAPRWAARNAS